MPGRSNSGEGGRGFISRNIKRDRIHYPKKGWRGEIRLLEYWERMGEGNFFALAHPTL